MFGINFNKKKTTTPNINPSNILIEKKTQSMEKTDFFKNYQNKKKELLPAGTITREELLKEIEKQFQSKKIGDSNPFKTRDDRYFLFYNSNMSLNREPVPFEEIQVGGKKFFINKRFENGKIIIDHIYGNPDIEINLADEYNKKETTKKQLEKLNQYILLIKDKIAKGHEKYNLLDVEDLKEEKWRLEKVLDSIKYGKTAIFDFHDPISGKKSYWLRYSNGEYNYLKVTENNYICEENNIKFLKGYEIQKRLQEIANLRIMRNWKEIIYGILVFVAIICFLFALFKLSTFEEDLFDKRVQEYCGDQSKYYMEQLDGMKDYKCEVQRNEPDFLKPK